MSLLFKEHLLRHLVTDELHARTFEPLRAPERVSHLSAVSGERGGGRNVEHLKRLLAHYGLPIPATVDQHYWIDLGPMRLRWERHTEFVTYTFSKHGAFAHPFADPLLDDLPQDWLRDLPGEVITATSLAIEPCDLPERTNDELVALFDGNPVIGSEVVGGCGACLVRTQDPCRRVLVDPSARLRSVRQSGRPTGQTRFGDQRLPGHGAARVPPGAGRDCSP